MELKTYEDGSVFTEKHVAFIGVVGLIGGLALFKAGEWISDKRTKRYLKKHGYPQVVIDRF